MLFLSKTLRSNVPCRWICPSFERTLSSFEARARQRLPEGPARTRFAPSPTGYLHLGSLRTALFNYLLAKSTGGQFLLRIEDTDQKRTVADAEERICQDLEWVGLQWDEGPRVGGPYGPYRQSQRTALYLEHAEILLYSGHAYRCFCTPQRLHDLAKKRAEFGQLTWYDRKCVNIPLEKSKDRAARGDAHVIRLKVPPNYPQFTDIVYGKVGNRQDQNRKPNLYPAFQDPILLKSDGFPTYHLANVVDDHHMKITHVVRGAEWMTSTHMHLAMYDAFHWDPPAFAHVGLLTDQNHQKLSKRNMDLDISTFRDKMGIFPETLTNFVSLLGWSHDQRKDVMNLQELVKNFTMRFTRGGTVVPFEKLLFLQRAHAEQYARSETTGHGAKIYLMIKPILQVLREKGWINTISGHDKTESYVVKLVQLDARNFTSASAFVDRNKYFFQTPDEKALLSSLPSIKVDKHCKWVSSTVQSDYLSLILSSLESIPREAWTADIIREYTSAIVTLKTEQSVMTLRDSIVDLVEPKKAAHRSWMGLTHRYIRWAIAAGLPGPDGAESMQILGKDETLTRLANGVRILAIEQVSMGEDQDTENTESHKSTQ